MTVPAGFDYRVREKLLAARTYYVATTGADTNDGLTAGAPFLTVQAAVNAAAKLDANGYAITIQIADGTYTDAVTLKNVVGTSTAGDLVIQGNNSTPANVIISTTSASAFIASSLSSVWDIKDLKVQTTTSGSCINSLLGSTVRFGNLVFGACAGSHLVSTANSRISCLSSYSVSGGATSYHYFASGGGVLYAQSVTITVTANITVTAWAAASILGGIINNGTTYSLGAYTVTGTKYSATLNGVVYTNGVTLPGGTAGSTATGGQYA